MNTNSQAHSTPLPTREGQGGGSVVLFAILMVALALSIHAHLLWPSVALGVALLWLCVSLYGRIGRLRYAYRETEKENEHGDHQV